MLRDRSKELEELTPEAQAALKKQRSLNRIFGLLVAVAVLLVAMLIYEIVILRGQTLEKHR